MAALAWVRGRQVPPRLLAIACNGALLGATMDATAADVWKEAFPENSQKTHKKHIG